MFLFIADVLLTGVFLGASHGGGEQGFGYFTACVSYFCIGCILGVLFAVASLVRRERPRWLAIIGLSLSSLPALGALYILAGAPL